MTYIGFAKISTQIRYVALILALMLISGCSSAVRFTQDAPCAGAKAKQAGTSLPALKPGYTIEDDTFSGPDGQEERNVSLGLASYYSDHFNGNSTASGNTYHKTELTAAHRDLPFGTRVRVTNLKNRKSVLVTINDRGPFVRGRVIDVSRAAAEELDMISDGVVDVALEVVKQAE